MKRLKPIAKIVQLDFGVKKVHLNPFHVDWEHFQISKILLGTANVNGAEPECIVTNLVSTSPPANVQGPASLIIKLSSGFYFKWLKIALSKYTSQSYLKIKIVLCSTI